MATTSVLLVFGTRPEIIKCSPLVREAQRRGVSLTVVHTGQHYTPALDGVFLDQLSLPTPDHHLGVGSGPHGQQTATMLTGLERIVEDERPDVVVVQGDTNSSLAGSLATCKLAPDLGHVEAGLRSFDRDMPEEHNRVIADHTADFCFAPTDRAAANLREEGIDDGVWVTGNTIVDAVRQNLDIARESTTVLADRDLRAGEFLLLTAHRAENVDDPDRVRSILAGTARAAAENDLDCLFPVHPRTAAHLRRFEIDVPDPIRAVDPVDFLEFLLLESEARLVITDSGGVQEETAILGTPCVTVRDNTERQETVEVGANVVAGTDADAIVAAVATMLDRPTDWPCPFGDGTAAEQILDVLLEAVDG
jgi:UDP-N-acetylglucosamine 2-epimerase (non-hydrolysing)